MIGSLFKLNFGAKPNGPTDGAGKGRAASTAPASWLTKTSQFSTLQFSSVSISGDISPNPRFWASLWRWINWAGDRSPNANFRDIEPLELAKSANFKENRRYWRILECWNLKTEKFLPKIARQNGITFFQKGSIYFSPQ